MPSKSKNGYRADRSILALPSAHQECPLTFKSMTSQVVQRARPLSSPIWLLGRQMVMIPGRDEPGRLTEVNLLNRAFARKLSTLLSAASSLASSKTPFRQTSRRIENVNILLCFALTNAPIDLTFSYIDNNVY